MDSSNLKISFQRFGVTPSRRPHRLEGTLRHHHGGYSMSIIKASIACAVSAALVGTAGIAGAQGNQSGNKTIATVVKITGET